MFSLTSKDTASVPRWNTDSKQLRWCRVHGRAAGERGALGLSITPQPGLPCLPLIRPRGISFVSPVATPALPGGTPAHASVGLETREPSRTPLHQPTATLPSACGPGAQAPCRQHPLQALRITTWPPGSRLGPPPQPPPPGQVTLLCAPHPSTRAVPPCVPRLHPGQHTSRPLPWASPAFAEALLETKGPRSRGTQASAPLCSLGLCAPTPKGRTGEGSEPGLTWGQGTAIYPANDGCNACHGGTYSGQLATGTKAVHVSHSKPHVMGRGVKGIVSEQKPGDAPGWCSLLVPSMHLEDSMDAFVRGGLAAGWLDEQIREHWGSAHSFSLIHSTSGSCGPGIGVLEGRVQGCCPHLLLEAAPCSPHAIRVQHKPPMEPRLRSPPRGSHTHEVCSLGRRN